nr:immunoglobulin heavy chain junction region [Macaca mulatta]
CARHDSYANGLDFW